MLESLTQWTGHFVELVWGVPLVVALVSSGIIFSLYFGFP
jgi:hypothetical protein